MKLGRLPHDQERLAGAPSLPRYATAAPPPAVDRSALAFNPLLGSNDTLPDCTAVATFNCAMASALAIGGFAAAIREDLAPRFYAECIGQPDAPDSALTTTEGAAILNVLTYAAQHGVDVGQQSRLVPDFGVIPADSLIGIRQAIAHLGACMVGVRLYDADLSTQALWDIGERGALVGLHAVMLWDYDESGLRIGTWGRLQRATWPWLLDRIDEAHGLAWRQLAPPGVDYAGLRAEVRGYLG